MFQKKENYRPVHVEFNVANDGSLMPESFGEFETPEEAAKFIGGNMVSVNQSITVSRHMDNFEKKELREEYNDVLENELPMHQKELTLATQAFEEAKKRKGNADQMVDATILKSIAIAAEVKRGLKEMNLDENYTSRIAYGGRYYYYTYMDKKLTLCRIQDIPECEKGEIFNQMCANQEFIDTNFGKATTQEGEKK